MTTDRVPQNHRNVNNITVKMLIKINKNMTNFLRRTRLIKLPNFRPRQRLGKDNHIVHITLKEVTSSS